MSALAGRHPLLETMETVVDHDPAVPGFAGRIAIGVLGDRMEFWCASFDGLAAQTWFSSAIPSKVVFDSILGVGQRVADTMLETGAIPAEGGLIFLEGERRPIDRFVARYLSPKTWLAFQTQRIQNHRKVRR